MTTWAYVRVSSISQTNATQVAAIRAAAEARGDKLEGFYREKRSGGSTVRPELDKVRELARQGKIRKLYVYRLDRLTRLGVVDTISLLEELKTSGCQVITVADPFDLGGPGAELVIAVLSTVAKIERQRINENISAARRRIERAGGQWGRPRRVTDDTIRKMLSLRATDMTIRQIAVALKVPRSTVAAVLSEKGAYARAKKAPVKKPLKKG